MAVVVPVLNEADSVVPLARALAVALAGIEWEMIFVDDGSTDGTIERLEQMASADQRIRVTRRIGRRGLSSAVMEGFLSTIAPVVAVIDGDGQHDETILPDLFRAVFEGGCELAVGTRYAADGSVGDWSAARHRISQLATKAALPFMKTPLSDPMSGFFAIRRDVAIAAAPGLSSTGYKLLLDIVATLPAGLRAKEVAYTFRSRTAGNSKLDSAVALEYFELLLDKLIGRVVPVKFVMFGAVGALGMGVHLIALALSLELPMSFAVAQAVAVGTAMTFNFTLNNHFTYRDRRLTGLRWVKGLGVFAAACGLGAVANIGAGSALYAQDASWWQAGLAGAVIGSVWNYVATSWFVWRRK
nr:glycosyltransferase family 2 protein [Pacificimonas pallii]